MNESKIYRANTKDEQFEMAWQDAVAKVDTIKADRAILIASNGVELIVSLTTDETDLHDLVYSACRACPECVEAITSGILAYLKENAK